MTIEEKRKKYDAECNKRTDCEDCPLGKEGSCLYPEYYSNSEERFDEALAKFEADNNKSDPGQPEFDVVSRPQHYASTSIECIDAMVETQGPEAVKDFCICNAFKYLWRHNSKNGDEDVRKANWYLNKAVELMDKEE